MSSHKKERPYQFILQKAKYTNTYRVRNNQQLSNLKLSNRTIKLLSEISY